MSGEAGGGYRYPDSPSETGDPVDRWFPRRGQCRICGVPGADQRHRVIEAIADMVSAGDWDVTVAADYNVPVEAVRACVEWVRAHPDGLEPRDEDETEGRQERERKHSL